MPLLRQKWWKYLGIILILYNFIAGLLIDVPRLDILNETIRNQFFHVPMWMVMSVLMLFALVLSILYLATGKLKFDIQASACSYVAIWFGIFGLTTGMLWAQFTWGAWWNGDPKQNAAAIALLIYLAYMILRNAIPDLDKKARIASIYNIFAFFAMIALIYIIPRMTDSLHPGSGGNPAFSMYDLDATMRMVFYPGTIGWGLIAFWIASIRARVDWHTLKTIDHDLVH